MSDQNGIPSDQTTGELLTIEDAGRDRHQVMILSNSNEDVVQMWANERLHALYLEGAAIRSIRLSVAGFGEDGTVTTVLIVYVPAESAAA